MKRKTLLIISAAEFAVLTAAAVLTNLLPDVFSSLATFPFEQIGALLRALSLSGDVGNGAALALYALLSLLPLIPVLRRKVKGFEALSLVLLSVSLFTCLYGMANASAAISPVLGGCVWSAAVLWLIARLLRLFRAGDMARLLGYAKATLCALCLLFAAMPALDSAASLAEGISSAQTGGDIAMALFRFAVSALPYALDIAVTLSAMSLAESMLDKKQDDIEGNTSRLSRLCCVSLGLVSAAGVLLNLAQVLLSRHLSDISVTVNIPVTSLAFVLCVLLVSRLIAENRRLERESELFI